MQACLPEQDNALCFNFIYIKKLITFLKTFIGIQLAVIFFSSY